MERNKWETAIRCLEVALHANTGDAEVIAAVNGFRRTADGRRLREICDALAGPARPAAPGQTEELARLNRENRELQGRLAAAEKAHGAAAGAAREAVQQRDKLREELRAAHEAHAETERKFAGQAIATAGQRMR